MPTPTLSWLDRAALRLAPRWQLRRLRARIAGEVLVRHYEGATTGRRTQGWRRSSSDPTQATGPYLTRLREVARDLVRNNPYAESGLSTIVDHTVGWGLTATFTQQGARAAALWQQWAGSRACDADGQNDFAGLQKLAMRTIVESGEVIIRRRLRLPSDGLPLPMQIQVLEPDFLDLTKDSLGLMPGGRRIVQGVEYDAIGRRIAYWLHREHPGSALGSVESVRVPAENVLHLFKTLRAGQVRGVSWFAPVLVRAKDLDDYEDATLMKQRVSACLAVITSDVDGTSPPLGATDTGEDPQIDSLEPGMILNVPPGRSIEVVEPPSVREYADYIKTSHRAIATGLGVAYEDLTGDYTEMPFSAARMSRLRHWSRVEGWRWNLLVPGMCNPVFGWFSEVAAIFGTPEATVQWTAQPAPMIDPVNEGLAYMRNIRAGLQTLSDALRERGYNPNTVLTEYAADVAALDRLKLILDSDPRQTTQAGQLQGKAAAAAAPARPAAEEADLEDEYAAAAAKLWRVR